MLFNSLDYLAFLALTLAVFWALRRWGPERDVVVEESDGSRTKRRIVTRGTWLRLLFVFLASCVFYAAWNWRYLGLIIFSAALDYFIGLRLAASKSPKARKGWLLFSISSNLGLLGVFKYYNFFVESTGEALRALFGLELDIPLLDVLLPVGISFYTFQTMSYTIDIYRGQIEPTRNPLKFGVFVAFFPQLVAGPIVRASEFLPQLERPPWLTRERVGEGLFLIALGITKKVVFADFISVNLVDRVFDNPSAFSSTEVLIGLYGFTLQIYADFSGYTDVARGSGKLFGFELPENFDRPYQAKSVAEFWRRWHMSLSTWLRDYLYFPLGGSRRGAARTYFNLWLTIFLIGVWHGASWTFVIYGNLQALAVIVNRFWARFRRARGWTAPDPFWVDVLKILATLHFAVFSRILFRATSLENAGEVTAQLFAGTTSVAQISNDLWRVLVLGFALHYVPRSQLAWARTKFVSLPAWAQGVSLAVLAAGLALFVTGGVVPYIYFQF